MELEQRIEPFLDYAQVPSLHQLKNLVVINTSDWTTAPNATCNLENGLIAEVRTKAGNCSVDVPTSQNAPCCQTGPWITGTCQPDGTLRKSRTVSKLCPSTESSAIQESCCYTSDWTNEPNAK